MVSSIHVDNWTRSCSHNSFFLKKNWFKSPHLISEYWSKRGLKRRYFGVLGAEKRDFGSKLTVLELKKGRLASHLGLLGFSFLGFWSPFKAEFSKKGGQNGLCTETHSYLLSSKLTIWGPRPFKMGSIFSRFVRKCQKMAKHALRRGFLSETFEFWGFGAPK